MTEQQNSGRGRPPAHRQFGRGQKRAAGRPKGAIGEKAIVQKIGGESHKVKQNGREIEVNTMELLLISMRNLAMSGDLRAAKWLTEYRGRILPEADNGGFLVVPEVMPIEEYIQRETFLNKFRTNPELKENPPPYPANSHTQDKA
jgi:Family of unknown function (DUF5681)